jgi:hypothetical protein
MLRVKLIQNNSTNCICGLLIESVRLLVTKLLGIASSIQFTLTILRSLQK